MLPTKAAEDREIMAAPIPVLINSKLLEGLIMPRQSALEFVSGSRYKLGFRISFHRGFQVGAS